MNITQKTKFLMVGWLVLPLVILILSYVPKEVLGSFFNPTQQGIDLNELTEVPKDILPSYTPYKNEGKGAVTIWFNNGWKSQYKYGLSILGKKNIKAAVSVITTYTDYPGYMNWNDLQDSQKSGWEIVSQGKTYNCKWDHLASSEVREEVYGSKRELMRHGIRAEHFASACGLVNLRLSDKAAYYYLSQKIGEEGFNQLPLENTYLLKGKTVTDKTSIDEVQGWIKQSKATNSWLILTFNKIEKSNDEYSISPDKFAQIVESITNSDVQFIVPSQIINGERLEGN